MFLRLLVILVAVFVVANGEKGTPSPPSPPTLAPFGFDYPTVVEKKAVSTRMRIVFLVGLEGTGHHYLAGVLQKMCATASVPCPNTCLVAHALYPGMSTPKTADQYEHARRQLRQEMEILASYPSEHLLKGEATMASFWHCRSSGMMSYPNYNGENKALQYVDFRLLAEEAERAGVDLRLVYLARSARSILISDTQHHHYGGTFMKESRTLINNAAVVESLFREVDPGFATCFRYEDMTDPGQASRVAGFIAPTEYVAQRLSLKILDSAKPSGPKEPVAKAQQDVGEEAAVTATPMAAKGVEGGNSLELSMELVIARLQQKLDQIEQRVCVRASTNSSNAP